MDTSHRWYARPVFFVRDLPRALAFYRDSLGFRTDWHSDEGRGTVCQVSRSECELILSQDDSRRDHGRLFIELTAAGLAAFRAELDSRGVPHTTTWWGYDTTQITDPDGNELLYPVPT